MVMSEEYAEGPREGELWQEMIERQQREGNNKDGYLRELMRSLPDEQQQEKRERSDSFEEILAQASQLGRQDRDVGLDI